MGYRYSSLISTAPETTYLVLIYQVYIHIRTGYIYTWYMYIYFEYIYVVLFFLRFVLLFWYVTVESRAQ